MLSRYARALHPLFNNFCAEAIARTPPEETFLAEVFDWRLPSQIKLGNFHEFGSNLEYIFASSNKCLTSSNRCLASRNKKLLELN